MSELGSALEDGTSLSTQLAFMERLRDGFMLVDRDWRVLWVNARGRLGITRFGLDPAQVIGQHTWKLFPTRRNSPVDKLMRAAWEEEGAWSLEYFFPPLERWYEVDVVRSGDQMGIFWRDVTEHKRESLDKVVSEAELTAANSHLERLIDDAPLAIIVLDDEARVLRWNPAAEKMFQWTSAEVMGKLLPTVPDEELDNFRALCERERRGESVHGIPARRRRKDGTVLDVRISTSPMRDASGSVIGVVGMIADVGEQLRLEQQLRTAQKMEAIGLLAGGVAHDFNNLLTAIKGFASLARMSLPADEPSQEYIREIDSASDRAAALTAQLLAFSRRQLLRPEPLDLNARIRDLERMLGVLLVEQGQLVLDLDPLLGMVLADRGQMEQVIMNLVVNARDAIRGRQGGRITLRTRNAQLVGQFAKWGVIPAPGPYVCLEVQDNGTGMSEAVLARIFDPFFTTKDAGSGSGLGLATVYGIVKQSGGYVWATSSEGQGASFSVYLQRGERTAATASATAVRTEGGNEIVLLVEDEDSVRRVARRALEMHGFRVVEAADGASAIARSGEHAIDMLVTDVMMPGMLGPTVAEHIRREHPDLPVLFMSGHIDEVVRDGLIDPRTPFLGKPFTPSELAKKVRETLETSRVNREP